MANCEKKENLVPDLTGLSPETGKLIRAYIDSRNSGRDFGRTNGIFITDVKPGYARVDMDITVNHLNPIHSVHGGAIFTLADVAAGCAAYSVGKRSTSVDADIHFLRPGLNKKSLYAESRIIKEGHSILVMSVSVFDQDGLLLASGTFTDMVLEEEKIAQAEKELLPELR